MKNYSDAYNLIAKTPSNVIHLELADGVTLSPGFHEERNSKHLRSFYQLQYRGHPIINYYKDDYITFEPGVEFGYLRSVPRFVNTYTHFKCARTNKYPHAAPRYHLKTPTGVILPLLPCKQYHPTRGAIGLGSLNDILMSKDINWLHLRHGAQHVCRALAYKIYSRELPLEDIIKSSTHLDMQTLCKHLATQTLTLDEIGTIAKIVFKKVLTKDPIYTYDQRYPFHLWQHTPPKEKAKIHAWVEHWLRFPNHIERRAEDIREAITATVFNNILGVPE